VTSAEAETVRGWFPADYAPDEVTEQTGDGPAALICWWD
jgi:hypothetical protein